MTKLLLHPEELTCLVQELQNRACCMVVGLSNTGKSVLLRALRTAEHRPPFLSEEQALLIYVDCNRILDLTEQGFYEAVLRATRFQVQEQTGASPLQEKLEASYQRVIHPANPFAIPLGFIEAIESLCEQAERRIVLILDEFDEPFEALEGRIFLNLRALRDRYGARLLYIVGVERSLDILRDDVETAEFRELFAGHTCRLGMQPRPPAAEWLQALAEVEGTSLSEEEISFILEEAGGHPGLLQAIARLLLRARSVAPETYARMGTELVEEALVGDEITRRECERLWAQLSPAERATVHALASREPVSSAAMKRIARLGLVDEEGSFYSAALASFVRRWGKRRNDLPAGIWLDVDAGEVYVEGRRAPTLTELEYRLLEVLYERKDKLCDKYLLVERVWGEEYIDEVDDARIEKLVSRLRAKIEEDASNPCYLHTIRGRGYRLVSRQRARPLTDDREE